MTGEFLKTGRGLGVKFLMVGLLALADKEMEEMEKFGLTYPRPKERPFHSDKPLPRLPEKPLVIPPRRKR